VRQVIETGGFAKWLAKLRDKAGRRAIVSRIARIVATGNFGDHASVGGNVSELRIRGGPGYRVYYTLRTDEIVLLLCGGAKDSQARDIEKAKELAAQLE